MTKIPSALELKSIKIDELRKENEQLKSDVDRLTKVLNNIVVCCDGNNPDHEQIYHIANDSLNTKK